MDAKEHAKAALSGRHYLRYLRIQSGQESRSPLADADRNHRKPFARCSPKPSSTKGPPTSAGIIGFALLSTMGGFGLKSVRGTSSGIG